MVLLMMIILLLRQDTVKSITFFEKFKLAEVETRKTAARDEDAAEYWRNKCSDLETLVLALEIENLTMRYEDRPILRCQELHDSENFECEARGLQNEITQTGEKRRHGKNNRSKPNAETSCEGRKNSHVYESESEFPKYPVVSIPSGSVHLLDGGDSVEEGDGWCCLEERPSQHGSSSQAHDLEMSNKSFGDMVSDDGVGDSLGEPEDSNSFVDSNISLGDPTDNKDELDWKSPFINLL
ncbi:uncharacterized protein LOC113338809 [Papaver somniferum]|uniref:uncharacterized protein LOC113338809 n=1 Tax=Papaver somniferum TaxID=3469 RepID=UPI000E6F99BD|nr:uncharacterized protein LOC113338809 [Papaver somniferum]